MKISCQVEGDPVPEVKFIKDGKAIKVKKNDRVKVSWNMDRNEYTLSVKDVTPEDSGIYSITVENKYGKIEKQVKAKITEDTRRKEEEELKKAKEIEEKRPKIIDLPEEVDVEIGKLIEISFKSQGLIS